MLSVSPAESPAIPRAAASTTACPTSVFASQSDFIDYLTNHPKSKLGMLEISSGNYSIGARRSITQVTVSKLVDVYGYDITTPLKQKVCSWLAEITKMRPTDFFDRKTHKGFLNKDLHNRRRKLPPEQKRWVWSKKKCGERHGELSSDPSSGVSSVSAEGSVSDTGNLLELDGCVRGIIDCSYCQGKCTYIVLY